MSAGRPPSLARAAATTYATNLAVAVLSLVNVLFVARALGPAGRGDVAFLIAVALLTSHLASFSLQQAHANLGAAEPETRRGLAANAVLFAAFMSTAAGGLVLGLVAAFPALGGEVSRTLLLIALAAIPALLLRSYLSFLVQADYGFAVTNVAWISGPLTSAIVNGVMASLGVLTVASATIAWLGGQTLGALILVAYVRRHAGFGRPDAQLARRTLGFGARSHVGHFMQVGNYRVDQWFLGSMVGSRELGLYSIAVAWAELLFYLPGVLVLVQRPDLVRADPQEAARSTARVVRVALVVAAGAATVLAVSAPLLCAGVFGEDFTGSVDDLRVLALGAFGIVAFELLRNTLTAQGKPMLASAAVGVAFILTIVLDLLLIPTLGGLGAAIATTAAYTGGGVAVALIFARALETRVRDLVPRPRDVGWIVEHVRGAATARRGLGKAAG